MRPRETQPRPGPLPAAFAGLPSGSATELVPGMMGEPSLADLQLIADSLTALAGFGAASIRIARRDGLHLVAVSGPEEARQTLAGTPLPVDDLEERVAPADDWGLFKFVPAERVGGHTGAGGVPHSDGGTPDPGAWHPLDLLVAPLRDEKGMIRGSLSVDLPADGRRPGPERRSLLDRYAALAKRAILLAVEREDLAYRVRLAEAARDVIRQAARGAEADEILDGSGASLIEILRIAAVWVHLVQPDGTVNTSAHHDLLGGSPVHDPELYPIATEAAHELWAGQRLWMLSITGDAVNVSDDAEGKQLALDQLARSGLGSVLCAPVGSGEMWYGALVIGRHRDAPGWSELELSTIGELGQDLGRVIHTLRTYQRQRQVVRSLQELDRHKTRLISTVAHELKTPLTAIRWNAETLPFARTDAEYADVFDVVQRNLDRTRQIVSDLAVLSSVTDPDQLPAAVPVAVAPVVMESRELVLGGQPERAIDIVLDLPREPTAVLMAPGELDRIVLNLLSNAVKYSPDCSIVVVSVRAAGEDVELAVADQGIGISAADQARLFEEFFRSAEPGARTQPGTGLGLTIIHHIVSGRGGRIDVESAPGRGSIFRVVLPRAAEAP